MDQREIPRVVVESVVISNQFPFLLPHHTFRVFCAFIHHRLDVPALFRDIHIIRYEQQSSWLTCDTSGFQVRVSGVEGGDRDSDAALLQFVILTRIPDPAEEFTDCFFVMYCG